MSPRFRGSRPRGTGTGGLGPRLLAVALLALTGCRAEGQVALRFQLDDDVASGLETRWLHIQARGPDDAVLSSLVVSGGALATLQLAVPHGEGRRIFLEIRDGQLAASSRVLAYGGSEPFDLDLDLDRSFEVPIRVRAVASVQRLSLPGGGGGLVRTATVDLELEPSRDDVRTVVLAQDPGLSFGRVAVPVEGGPRLRVPYDLDVGCRSLGACLDGPRSVFVQLVDAAGYPSISTSTVVLLDREPPVVVPGSVALRFEAPGALVEPIAAGEGVTIRLSFALTEATSSTPSVSLAGSGLRFDFAGRRLGTLSYTRRIGAEDADGVHAPQLDAVDLAGNRGTSDIGAAYTVDRSRPPPPAVDAPGRIVYTRAPWGDERERSPQFGIVGGPGAVEPGVRVLAFDRATLFDPEGRLIAARAGETVAEADGRFRIALGSVDRTELFLLLVDEAGNLHADEATRIRDVRWVVPGSSPSGPPTPTAIHGFEALPASLRTDALDAEARVGVDLLDPAVPGLRVTHRLRWSEWRAPPSIAPEERRLGAMSYDAARDRTVLFGGRIAPDTPTAETWEWDGASWSSQPLSGTEPDCDDGTIEGDDPFGLMAWLPGVDRNVLVCRRLRPRQVPPLPAGGTDALIAHAWDGARWGELSFGPGDAPSGRVGHALAHHPPSGGLVLFGGNQGNILLPGGGRTALADTWVLEAAPPGAPFAVAWRRVEGSSPPARDRHAMIHDPASGELLLFGGFSAASRRPALDDLWAFDGTRWRELPRTSPWPPARGRHAMVRDPRTGAIGVLGGVSTEPRGRRLSDLEPGLDDAWWWDGRGWTRTATRSGTPGGAGLVAATHGERHALVLSATTSAGVAVAARTWHARPDRLRDRSPSAERPPSQYFLAAYDDTEEAMTLIAGSSRGARNELIPAVSWRWTPSGWRQDASPDPVEFGVVNNVVHDPRERGIVAFVRSTTTSETYPQCNRPAVWRLDADGWTLRRALAPGRYPYDGHWSAYDAYADRLLMLAVPFWPFVCPEPPVHFADLWGWAPADDWQLVHSRPNFIGGLNPGITIAEPGRLVVLVNATQVGQPGWQTFYFDGNDWSVHPEPAPPWSALVGARDLARGRSVVVGGDAGAARLWSLDGLLWRERPTRGVAPSFTLVRSLGAATRARELIAMVSERQAGAGSISRLRADPDARPAVRVLVDLETAGLADAALTRVRVDATAGGDGDGGAGARLVAWSGRTGGWQVLASNAAAAAAPAALQAELDTDAASALPISGPDRLVFAIETAGSVGGVYEDPELQLDRVLVSIDYRLAATP